MLFQRLVAELNKEQEAFIANKHTEKGEAVAPWVGAPNEDILREECLSLSTVSNSSVSPISVASILSFQRRGNRSSPHTHTQTTRRDRSWENETKVPRVLRNWIPIANNDLLPRVSGTCLGVLRRTRRIFRYVDFSMKINVLY